MSIPPHSPLWKTPQCFDRNLSYLEKGGPPNTPLYIICVIRRCTPWDASRSRFPPKYALTGAHTTKIVTSEISRRNHTMDASLGVYILLVVEKISFVTRTGGCIFSSPCVTRYVPPCLPHSFGGGCAPPAVKVTHGFRKKKKNCALELCAFVRLFSRHFLLFFFSFSCVVTFTPISSFIRRSLLHPTLFWTNRGYRCQPLSPWFAFMSLLCIARSLDAAFPPLADFHRFMLARRAFSGKRKGRRECPLVFFTSPPRFEARSHVSRGGGGLAVELPHVSPRMEIQIPTKSAAIFYPVLTTLLYRTYLYLVLVICMLRTVCCHTACMYQFLACIRSPPVVLWHVLVRHPRVLLGCIRWTNRQ